VNVILSIATNIAADALLALFVYTATFLPQRLLWRMHDVKRARDVSIYISFRRHQEETRVHRVPVVGLGQVGALACVLPSLTRAYWRRSHDVPRILPAQPSLLVSHLTGNIVMIGGQSSNEATRRLLERCEPVLGVRQQHGDSRVSGDRLFFRATDGSWAAIGGVPVDGTLHHIEEDYGLIVRIPNPWDPDRKSQCVLLCGVMTYGTAAAAQYFVKQKWKPTWWSRRGIMALVRAEIDDGHIVNIQRLHFRRLKSS
jgi:hypothetical protein